MQYGDGGIEGGTLLRRGGNIKRKTEINMKHLPDEDWGGFVCSQIENLVGFTGEVDDGIIGYNVKENFYYKKDREGQVVFMGDAVAFVKYGYSISAERGLNYRYFVLVKNGALMCHKYMEGVEREYDQFMAKRKNEQNK